MSGETRRTVFLSEGEFGLCCAAAGIRRFPGFRFRSQKPMSREAALDTVARLVNRKLVRQEGEKLALSPEISAAFRAMGKAKRFLEVIHAPDMNGSASAILFRHWGWMASLCPGWPEREYVGLTLYPAEDLAGWLEDQQLLYGENPPPELLRGIDVEEPEGKALRRFLELSLWPDSAQVWKGGVPAELKACMNIRAAGDGRLEGRIYLLRPSLYDLIAEGSPAGLAIRYYSAEALAETVDSLLKEG